jgi:hypothetical protein
MNRKDTVAAMRLLNPHASSLRMVKPSGNLLVLEADLDNGTQRTFYDLSSVEDYIQLQRLSLKVAHGCTDSTCPECDA